MKDSNRLPDPGAKEVESAHHLEDQREWVLRWLGEVEKQLIHYALRLSNGRREIAIDAVQHAFLKLCDQSPQAIGSRLPGWLYRVCRNKVFDELRAQGREQELLPEPASKIAQRELTPDQAAESADLNLHLRKMMERLPPSQRESLDLWCRGFEYREIAEITGKSYSSVRVSVHRGLTHLRTQPRVKRWLDESPQPSTSLAESDLAKTDSPR